jgi:pimeloyl-ACP methyl ester carboxylesterase
VNFRKENCWSQRPAGTAWCISLLSVCGVAVEAREACPFYTNKTKFVKTTVKAICLGICFLALFFSQQAKALPPYFYSARWADGTEVDSSPIGNRIPLILIHGIQEDSTIWTNFLNYWANSPNLRSQFKPFEFGYYTDNSYISSGDPTSVYQLGQDLGGYLQQGPNYGLNGAPVTILAHSMGGLVARSMMANYFFSDHTKGDSKVSLLITLATPHHGTPAANDYFMWYVGIPVVGSYTASIFFNLNPGFASDLAWDAYDGRTFSFPGPDILSDADYSKIVAYGALAESASSQLQIPYTVLTGYGYASDGVVPIQSALFSGATVKTRLIDGSCDHLHIYLSNNTVNGTPIFDSIANDLESIVPYTPSPPIITSVSPPTLTGLPIGQTQLIRIIGSGFTSGCTLTFNDGVDVPFTGRVPTLVSANELDYNITVGTNAASWTVQVVNGSQTSNLGYFTVNAPPTTPSGSLVVNLSPAGAVSAGAQWQVDGGSYYSSGGVAPVLTPGSHTVSFKFVSGYTTPANQVVNITANTQATASASYTAIAASTYTLTLNYNNTQGGASASPSASGNIYTVGTVVQLYASASSGYHFTGWSGNASGTANPITVTMNGNENITANFASGDPTLGTVIVTIQPPAAAAAGVTWGFNVDDFRASGSSYTTFPATYILDLHTVAGWVGPSTMVATLTADQTTNYAVTFTPDATPGLLTVTLSPPDAVAAGAQWHVNGGAGQGSGATVQLAPGSGYTITYDSIPEWTAPPGQTVTIQRAQTTAISGNYTPPAGQPSIVSIQPNVGTLTGGTLLNIQGYNFTAPTTVIVGGQIASNINVVSDSQITCFTPSNSVYGTVPVVVQTTNGSTTNLTGFAYGIPRGNGITLAGSIGGYINAVTVQGNDCYIGEGSTFTVLDVSNPAAPTPIARLALPGLVQDIALFSASGRQYAAVANGDAGLQIVDVTTPTAPALRGYYNTGDWANGVAISNNFAYVANNNSGLVVLDISNPTQPKLSGSVAVVGEAFGVAVQQITNHLFAFVATGSGLCVVDVANPNNPVLQGSASPGGYNACVAVNGSRAYLAYGGYLQAYDISNPASPQSLGSAAFDDFPTAVTIANNQIYAVGYSGLNIYNLVGNNLQRAGYLTGGQHDNGDHMMVAGGYVFCSGGTWGFHVYNANNPSSPVASGVFNTTVGYYNSIALSGTTVFASTENNGLKAFDFGNPANPNFLSQYIPSFNGGYGGQKVQISGSRSYFVSSDQINVVDMSNPQSPMLLGTNSTAQFLVDDLYLLGNSVVAAGFDTTTAPYTPAVAIFNASNPASIGMSSKLDFSTQNGAAYAVSGNSNIAYVAVPLATGSDFSLAVVNVSNPTSLQQIGQIPDIGVVDTMRLAPDNRYLYVGCYNTDLSWKIIDLANSNSPVMVSSNYVGAAVLGFDFSGTTAYVAVGTGILVYDVSNPSQPQLLRSYSTPTVPSGITVSGNTLYVADNSGGLTTLTLSDINPPEVFITTPTSSPIYTNTTGTLNLGGTADDNLGLVQGTVAGITWANSQGGSGPATGTTNWSVTNIMLLPGTNVLTVTATDMSGNSSNATLTVIYQSTNQNQTITFPAIADHTFGDLPIQLVAAAGSGLPVTFSVVSGPATLSTSNVLTLTGAGAVTVEADQSGNSGFNPALPVDISFNVAQANQSIAFAPLPNHSPSDPPFTLIATTSSGLPVFFEILSGPAVLDTNNVVTLLGAGTVTAVAWQPGDSNYNAAATVEQSFNVSQIPQTITFGALSQQKVGDAPFTLNAIASSGLPVGFSISGPAVLSGNIVTLTGYGTVTVTASQPGNNTYAPAANVTEYFIVTPPDNTLVSLGFQTNGAFQMAFYGTIGSNYTLQASTDLANWTSLLNFTCTNPFSQWTSTHSWSRSLRSCTA